jgi:tetratricopeptide (TPR) repeat protein
MPTMHPRLRSWFPGLTLAAIAILVYLPTLRAGFIWDDDLHVTANATLTTSWRGLYDIWFGLFRHTTCQYYPLSFTAFWIQYQLWGLNPLGYHLVNILLHALNTFLFWRLLTALLAPQPALHPLLSPPFLAATLFAIHPVNVMSVAWVTELKNGLAGTCMLLTLHAFCRMSIPQPPATSSPTPIHARQILFALLLFTLAMFAKTASAVLIPAMALLLWWRKPNFRARDLLPLLPFLLIAGTLVAVTVHVEQGRVWGADPRPTLNLLERLLLASRAFWAYLGHLLWPANLIFTYPAWIVNARAPLEYLPLLALVALLTLLWRQRHRWGRGPFAAVLYFFIAAPALILFQTMYMMRYTPIADHWQYFGSPALFALAASAAGASAATHRRTTAALAAAITILLAATAWHQCGMYRDLETLWLRTLERNPRSWLAANNLGVLYEGLGRQDDAVALYQAALAADPGFADTHSNLGAIAYRRMDHAAAEAHFRNALAVNPAHVQAHVNIAILLADQRRAAEALDHVTAAETLKADGVEVRFACGYVCRKLGRRDEAIRHYREVLRLAPGHPGATRALDALTAP